MRRLYPLWKHSRRLTQTIKCTIWSKPEWGLEIFFLMYSVLGNSGLGPWGQPVEQVLTAVPGGTKAMSIYRTLADERIPLADRLFKLGINLTAGAKLTDVDVERTRKQAARNVLTDILDMQPGVKTYENITVPEDVLRAMPKDQQQMYLLYKILQSQASKRAREKRKLEMDPLQMLGVVQQDLA